MTNEQIVLLINTGEDVAENMLQLWKKNKALIGVLATKYTGYAELEDLEQEGYIGLCEAVRHYDAAQGVTFATYAVFWIKQRMRRFISNCTSAIRIPEYARTEVQQYKKFIHEYCKYYGKGPTDAEIAGYLCVSIKKLEIIKSNASTMEIQSLNKQIGEEENTCLEDFVASDQELEEDAIKRVDTAAMGENLWKAVDSLPGDMSDMIRYRYKNGLTLKQSGEQMGVTIEAARQREAKALRALRRPSICKTFKPYYDQYLSAPIRHVGVSEFNRTWTSATELAALEYLKEFM